jgi:CHAT domain-containing protein/Tfp pilus assembly protein PilF
MLLLLLAGNPTATTLPPAPDVTAGQQAFQRGDFERAAVSWREVVRRYAATGPPQTQSLALTQLARAYEALGHYGEAEQRLREALQLAQAADPAQRADILGALGSVALAMGNLPEAERRLHEALALATTRHDAGLAAGILHNLGNLFLSQQQLREAFDAYQRSAALAQQQQRPGAAARAVTHTAIVAERQGQFDEARVLLEAALTHLDQVAPSHDKAYDLLLIGRLYHRLAGLDEALRLRAADVLHRVAELAQALQNVRALSYAWGYLGRLYEDERRYQEALQLTRRAVLAAQQVHAPESLYLWQWQTGRLLRALGEPQPALAAYERAVAIVQTIRPALLRSAGGGATAFRTSLGPLYFELVDLFLQQAARLEAPPRAADGPQYAAYLQRARDTVEQFKAAELRDYFGDECIDAARSGRTAVEHVAADTLIVYPILLPDRSELLVSLPTGLMRLVVPVTGPQLEQRVRVLRNALEDRDAVRYLRHAQSLYTWLVQPLEAALSTQQFQTIVFVPDGALRALPFAALHDGQRFLIEKYALAVTPSLSLTEPQPLSQDDVQVLAAGVAVPVAEFPPLPRVPAELQEIQRLYGGVVLLNQDFSPENFEQTVKRGQYGIVHSAAHGQFAAEVAQSFLLTTHGKLTIDRLAQIVSRVRFRDQPLELLTLSACETARGDDRAALGLAGVAIKAGARSALATLWLVEDEAAAALMTEFYRQLQRPGVSKARALQQAQLSLLRQPQYAEPFFWAPFLLINNWL